MVEFVGLIIDSSGSMGSSAYGGLTKFEAALETAADLLNRLSNSSKADFYYTSLIGFNCSSFYIPPFNEYQKYIHILDFDIENYKHEIYQKVSNGGCTSYDSALLLAKEISKEFLDDISEDEDTIYMTRIMLTDGCHNTCVSPGSGRTCAESASNELKSLENFDPETQVNISRVVAFMGRDGICPSEVCSIVDPLQQKTIQRLQGYLSSGDVELNGYCPSKASLIVNSRTKEALETLRNILRIVTTTRQE